VSGIIVDRQTYVATATRRVAQLLEAGMDLRAAREQTAFEMRDWSIDEATAQVEQQRDRDEERQQNDGAGLQEHREHET
jgi:hypothetical protein